MSSVADQLRAETRQRLLGMEADARLELALRLGDEDVAVLCAVRGIPEAHARLTIERSRQAGRRPSACAQR